MAQYRWLRLLDCPTQNRDRTRALLIEWQWHFINGMSADGGVIDDALAGVKYSRVVFYRASRHAKHNCGVRVQQQSIF